MECCEKYAGACFVYGSNLAGRNGRGAAKHAQECHGARYGTREGFSPDRRSYAIPTKGYGLRTLPLSEIRRYVTIFLAFANDLPFRTFLVTAIGTGLAGYSHEQIAPMFADAPLNCILPKEWEQWTRPNREEDNR